MILLHPLIRVVLVPLHHVVVRISVHDLLTRFPAHGVAFWSDEWCSALADNESAVLSGQIPTVCIDIPEIPERLEKISELGDLMNIGLSEMKADDGAPLHVDGCMEFYVLFRPECPFSVLPRLVELPDAESSCIDGNVLSFFLNDMVSCWFNC